MAVAFVAPSAPKTMPMASSGRVVEHLEPPELPEDGVDVGPFACGREGVRDRPAHRLLHRGALSGVDHSSLPSWRSRRAMMLRCTSAVPP